jgi:hypothetical protein
MFFCMKFTQFFLCENNDFFLKNENRFWNMKCEYVNYVDSFLQNTTIIIYVFYHYWTYDWWMDGWMDVLGMLIRLAFEASYSSG